MTPREGRTGDPPELDLAVHPVEGTRLLALGRPNAIDIRLAPPEGVKGRTP